jgi:hypothetical protein
MSRWNDTILTSPLVWLGASLALGLVLASALWANAFLEAKRIERQTLSVTGAAQQPIVSDLAVWRLRFSRQGAQQAEVYQALAADLAKVRAFLTQHGVDDKQIELSPIQNTVLYAQTANGSSTNQIEAYRLQQSLKIESMPQPNTGTASIDALAQLSQQSTSLIQQGIGLESDAPEYYYTKLDQLKVEMLGKAMANARDRAQQMARSVGNHIGPLRSGQMGVFQITPKHSTEVSDYGINDTSTREKTVTAVVNATFALQ